MEQIQYSEEIVLSDGTCVQIRPIIPEDAKRLQETFTRLSPESIYLRFLSPITQLTDEQAQKLATVDYCQRMALVLTIRGNEYEHIIGVARYTLVGEIEPGLAEAAVIVEDSYQHHGLGLIALDRLGRYARDHGVTAFLATIHMSNARMLKFIRRSGLAYERKMIEPGTWEIRIFLLESNETC